MSNKTNNEIKRQKKVLYLEDEPFVVKKLVLSLELLGWNVTLVTEIEDLFNALETNRYDIIMLDIMIPVPKKMNRFTEQEINQMDNGMSTGIVLAKKIFSMEEYQQLPILFHSAKKNPLGDNPNLPTDKCGYLRKPELATLVADKLDELIKS